MEGNPSSRQGTRTSPAGEVHVPRWLEGFPSSRRGTCLAGWKATLPVNKVHASPTGRTLPVEMVKGYPSRIPIIRWPIPACANGYPPAGADGPFSANCWRVSGYPKGYPRPEGDMAGWKEALPAGKVQVPRRLEGHPSSRRGKALPVDEVQVPRLEIVRRYLVPLGGYRPHPPRTRQAVPGAVPGAGFLAKTRRYPGTAAGTALYP
ncbi:hypothetical protein PGT21_035022 [Puccinia graminis f. sp. tritici]|uniref:Uncharacterized protein n=1 Tax=Puccinia graminis f. sp. tritici TaxID=56615 RepID=A0A5B0PLC1_PUCGR|nr:hypothetical protein PGT21_035022 [Puccinia graminis f. sp. tritici]